MPFLVPDSVDLAHCTACNLHEQGCVSLYIWAVDHPTEQLQVGLHFSAVEGDVHVKSTTLWALAWLSNITA